MDGPYPPGKLPVRLTPDNIQDVLSRYDTLLLDNDGVLWDNNQITKLEGVAESVNKLRGLGKRLLFLSNNPYLSKEEFLTKYATLAGFTASAEDVITVRDALVTVLRDISGVEGTIYVIGEDVLNKNLEEAGFSTTGVGPNPEADVNDLIGGMEQFFMMKLESNIGAVLVTLDGYFSYSKCFKALNYLRNPACQLIATSSEPSINLAVGGSSRVAPGPGCIVAALEAGSGRHATVVGKPSTTFFECAKQQHPGIDPARTIMIGDLLKSDIQFAANCGLDSILVCTGSDSEQTTREQFEKNPNMPLPTYIIDGLGDIGKWI